MSLTDIANKHFTDKGTLAFEAHGYTEEYSKYIPSTGVYNLLEIGVYHGDSLRMWKEYNNQLRICGIDIDTGIWNYIKDKITDDFQIYIGNSTNDTFITEIIESFGIPDFIIDDGSHYYNDILTSFKLLYPLLKKGGIYFIEDLHANQSKKEELIKS